MVEIKEIESSETWPLRFEVLYPETSLDFVKLPKDSEGVHLGLFYNKELVSVISLFIIDEIAQFRKLATKESVQGKGFGTMLLNHVFDFSSKLNCTRIWCNARQDKSSFYQKFDMIETSNKFRKDDIDFVIMEKFL